ncbi:MAG TPA: S9 family peptidase [Thermoanaerobaculia bacterium]|nr:S9 family peptidase [Thermoanaerobaculia bacterium]
MNVKRLSLAHLALAALLLAPLSAQAADLDQVRAHFRQRFVDGPSLAPDGRVAFQVTEAKIGPEESELATQIWLARADGSESRPLTRGKSGAWSPAFSPDGRTLAFLSDRGDTAPNLWLLPMAGGEAFRLTEVKEGVSLFRWSPDGAEIAFLARDPKTPEQEAAEKAKTDPQVVDTGWRFQHLWKVAVAGAEERPATPVRLTSGAFEVDRFHYSPDGRQLVFSHHPTPRIFEWRNADLSLVATSGGEVVPLVRAEGMDTGGLFSPDGKLVAFVSDRGERAWARDWRICLIPAAGGEVTVLPRSRDSMPGENIDAGLLGWSPDGRGIYYVELNGVSIDLFFAPADGGPHRQVTTLAGAKGNFTLSAEGDAVAFWREDFTEPGEIYVQRLPAGEPLRLTRLNDALRQGNFPKSEVVRWPGTAGEVEGILHYPQDHQPGTPFPLLVELHGGPTWAFLRSYVAAPFGGVTPFTDRGFGVLQVNFRGSAGYGKEFRFAVLGDMAGGEVDDALAGVDVVVGRGLADPNRLGVFGGSYGGFLTASTIWRSPRFDAAVVGFGMSNLVSFNGTADILGYISSFMQSELWEKPELWTGRSAVFNAHKIRTPTLVIHGEKDQRVPVSQGYELYQILRRRGVPTEMVVYPRSGHGIGEPKLRYDETERTVAWFERWVR